ASARHAPTGRTGRGPCRGAAAQISKVRESNLAPARFRRRHHRRILVMQIGMMGLGRMGGNMVRRLMRAGHECVVHDIDPKSVATLAGEGATGASSMEELVAKLATPRHIWLMLPAAITGGVVEQLAALMEPGDTIIDGGNSN